ADPLSDGQRAVRGRHPGPAPGRAAARGGRDSAARRSARRASEREPADARDRPGITAPGRGGAHGAATALPGAAADHATRGARDAAQRGRRAPAAAAVTAPGAEASAPRPDPTRDDAPARATGRAPERRVRALGVHHAVIPKPGFRSRERIDYERQRWFRRGRAWRAGGEARIARLKHCFGMARSRYRGERGMVRTVYWAAIANNLTAIATR